MECEKIKSIIAESENMMNLPAEVEKHLESCGDCRAFLDACVQVESRLTSEKPQSVSRPDLAERIIIAITDQPQPKPAHRPDYRLVLGTFGRIAASVVIIACLWAGYNHLNSPTPSTNGGSRLVTLSRILSHCPHIAGQAISGIFEKPLENEYNNLKQQTKSAAGFLVSALPPQMKEAITANLENRQ